MRSLQDWLKYVESQAQKAGETEEETPPTQRAPAAPPAQAPTAPPQGPAAGLRQPQTEAAQAAGTAVPPTRAEAGPAVLTAPPAADLQARRDRPAPLPSEIPRRGSLPEPSGDVPGIPRSDPSRGAATSPSLESPSEAVESRLRAALPSRQTAQAPTTQAPVTPAPTTQTPAAPEPARQPAARARDGAAPSPAGRTQPAREPAEADPAELWSRVPKHLQSLLRDDRPEVASRYYKTFKEDRAQLLQRLMDPELSLEEAARVLGVCPTTVRRYTNRGLLKHHRTAGNQRRFRLSDVLEFLERQQG